MNTTACEIDENEHCFRGLERKTEDGARKREINKLKSIGAVLTEQHRQELAGVVNEIAVARAYIGETLKAKERALDLAAADERENGGAPPKDEKENMQYSTNTTGKSLKKKLRIKRFLISGAQSRRRAVLEDIFALAGSPAMKCDIAKIA